MNWRKEIEEFKASLLDKYLAMCDEKQQAFFRKIFPNGPSSDDYDGAMDLIGRTLAKNEKRKLKSSRRWKS